MAVMLEENDTSASIDAQLDRQIESLQTQIKALKNRRRIQTSTILSSRSSNAFLSRPAPLQSSQSALPSSTTGQSNPLQSPLAIHSKNQISLDQSNLYRTCACITFFKVQDPDPNAVDNGAVFGIKIETFTGGKFIRPYYVLLNKPYPSSDLLRVHRHTVPTCIPLEALVKKYLPSVAPGADILKARKQNLPGFCRRLRKEIAGYHNRVAVIAGLRKMFALDEVKTSKKGKGRQLLFQDISAADAEARQIRLEWVDGRVARIVIGEKGEVKECCVMGLNGRERPLERMILGGDGLAESIGNRLTINL